MNMLQFIRRNLLANKCKQFDQGATQLEKVEVKTGPGCVELPRADWTRKDDKTLLKLIATSGFDCDLTELYISKEQAFK
jgi:hypothetical protein